MTRRFAVIGHRGARGLALENSLDAFQVAVDCGVDGVEFDVVMTRDRRLAIFHDISLRGADGAHVPFASLDLADARSMLASNDARYAADGSVPELGEVLSLLAGSDVRLDVELKSVPVSTGDGSVQQALIDAVLAELDRCGVRERSALLSFDAGVLALARMAAGPEMPLTFNYSKASWAPNSPWLAGRAFRPGDEGLLAHAADLDASCVQPAFPVLTASLVATARDAGMRVVPWVVNDEDNLRKVGDWGVHGVCTDNPDVAIAVSEQMGAAAG